MKMGGKKGVEGENASYCLLRCNREKPQELTKFARLFIIFSYKIIFDSFTAQLFIILSKNIFDSFIKQPAQISAPWQAYSQSSFRSLWKIVKICFLTNVSHWEMKKEFKENVQLRKLKKKSGLGRNVEARDLSLSCQRSWEMTVPRFVHSSGLDLRRKW